MTPRALALVCALCEKPATEFRDDLSRHEFSISGTCQKCQDDVFAEPEPEDGDEVCPHCGSVVCYFAESPDFTLRCGTTRKVIPRKGAA